MVVMVNLDDFGDLTFPLEPTNKWLKISLQITDADNLYPQLSKLVDGKDGKDGKYW